MGKTFRHKLTEKQATDKYGKHSKYSKSNKSSSKDYYDEEYDNERN